MDTCVAVFAIAGGLSLLGGIVVGAAARNVLGGLFVGTVTAAVWVGFAAALLLLRQIAVGQLELVELLRAERSGQ